MAQYQNAADHRPYFQPRFVPSKVDPLLKIDEGYSEDTRSQDDPDSPMRMDALGESNLTQSWSSAAGVPHHIMMLSEVERSSKAIRLSLTLNLSLTTFDGRLRI